MERAGHTYSCPERGWKGRGTGCGWLVRSRLLMRTPTVDFSGEGHVDLGRPTNQKGQVPFLPSGIPDFG